MNKRVYILFFCITILGCSQSENKQNNYLALYKYISSNNIYQTFDNVTFVKRGESDSYLYYDGKYNLTYWFSINTNNFKIDEFNEVLKKKNSHILASQFPDSNQQIENQIMNNIHKSVYILVKFNLLAINGISNDSLNTVVFTFNDNNDLVYWDNITTKEINKIRKGKSVNKINNHWYYIKNK